MTKSCLQKIMKVAKKYSQIGYLYKNTAERDF